MIVCFINFKTNGRTVTPGAGTGAAWTQQWILSGTNRNASFFTKIANGTEPATYTITIANSLQDQLIVTMLLVPGADLFSVAATGQGLSSNTPNASSLTTTRCNELVFADGVRRMHVHALRHERYGQQRHAAGVCLPSAIEDDDR